ncbi:MAG: ABC transporter substrate-binding protein, partial [Bradyrhizobium sp.]
MNSVISRRSLVAGMGVLPFVPHLVHAQASEPIRIGVLAPLTGGGGPYGADIVKASKLAADQINAAGGVLGGRKLELFVEDDETNATAAVKAARKLLDIDKVVAITAVWGSAPILAVRPLTLEKNVVLTVLGSADEVTEGDTKGLVWRFQARASSWGEPAALAILKGGYKKIGLLHLQNPFVASMIPSFVETIEKGGSKVISDVEYKPDQPSYRAEVEKVYAGNPDAVFVPGYVN